MKKLSFIAIMISLVFAACSLPGSQKKYVIHVQAEEAEGEKLLLQKRVQGEWEVVDSSHIAQGKAVFEGKMESPERFFLSLEETPGFFGFFAEPAEMTIVLNAANIRESVISGSQTQDRFASYTTGFEAFNDELSQHHRAYRQAEIEEETDKMKEAELAFAETERRQLQYLIDYVRENPDDVVAHYVLFRDSYLFELEELEALVMQFDPQQPSAFAAELRDRVALLKQVAIGQPFVDFAQENPAGEMIALSDLVGQSKYLLVDFWASWCVPCRNENPNIVAVHEDYRDKGFGVFGVSLDTDKDKWIEAIEADRLDWENVSDLAGWSNAASKMYGVRSIPHSVLLDEQGIIIDKNLRAEALRERISALLD